MTKVKKAVVSVKNKLTEEQKVSGLLWTFTGLRVTSTEFEPTHEGVYRLTFEDGRTLEFTAVGDDMTYCSMEILRPK